jgi:NitT/TauT family transport system substrate-binding protein
MRRVPWLLLVTALLSCHGARPGARVATVRIAIHREPIAFLPVRVAQTLGYYDAEGLAVELSEVAGGTKAIEALLGGSVDVAAASMSDVVQLAAEGRDVRGFLVLYTRPSSVLAVAPALSGTIRTIRDLRGHTVGVSTPGSWTHQFLNFLLVTNDLSPEDVSTVSVGMSASSVAALEHGTVDAAVLLASAVTAFEERHTSKPFIADTRTLAGARQVFGSEMFPSLSLLAENRWLRANPDTAQRVARAVKKGMRWVRDGPAEQVRQMIPEAARMSEKADLQAIQRMQQGLSTDGLMPEGSAELVEKFVAVSNPKVRAAHIDTARIYTNEFASAR